MMRMKLAERIAQSLRLAASSNSQTSAAAAAVLWPDKDGHWQAALPQLAAYLPSLMVLGHFDPEPQDRSRDLVEVRGGRRVARC